MGMQNTKYKLWTEKMAIVAAIAYPASAIPQVIKIFTTKDAADLSLITWLSWTLLELFLLAYGIAHKLRPVIISGVLWTIAYVFIIVGILIYG